ncbi:unnamed protein product [Arabidopsis thaliana]|uniref:(thale cress) hypothetical protein n=1 Tax=Arabidopsis thaliana TaxID=3702 RepID=A0A7G2F508_ARATH|nr:unnamed protein product [Arabidopsis thaliana]
MQQRKLTEESEHIQALLCVDNFACACSPLFLSVAYLCLLDLSLSLSLKFGLDISFFDRFLSSRLLCTFASDVYKTNAF